MHILTTHKPQNAVLVLMYIEPYGKEQEQKKSRIF